MANLIKELTKGIRRVNDAIEKRDAKLRKHDMAAKAETSDEQVEFITSIIWQLMDGNFTMANLRRGVRRARNEFYTIPGRSDTAFTAAQTELNSARARIRDLELTVKSCEEIVLAAVERDQRTHVAMEDMTNKLQMQANRLRLLDVVMTTDDPELAIKTLLNLAEPVPVEDDPAEVVAFEQQYAETMLKDDA